MTPGQLLLARRRAERAAQYAAELAEAQAKPALPDADDIAAAKQAAEAERLRLEAAAAAEKNAIAKAMLTRAIESAAAQKVVAESLERAVQDKPTAEDAVLLAKIQEDKQAQIEDKAAWLEKQGA